METSMENEEVLKTLKPGDLVRFDRGYYEDWAVYIGQDEGLEKVIYWLTGNRNDFQTLLDKTAEAVLKFFKLQKDSEKDWACVRISPFSEVAGTSRATKSNEEDRDDERNGAIECLKVVEGAKAFKDRTEREDASGLFTNSEYFAKWCRYGPLVNMSAEKIANLQSLRTFVNDSKTENNNAKRTNKEHNTKLLSTLKEGDLIRFRRTFYSHWAVYIGKDNKGDITVIHWSSPTDSRTPKKGASITIDSFWVAADGDKGYNGNDNAREEIHIDGRQVVIRAKVKQFLFEKGLVEETYHLLFNNCQHFAKWCRYESDASDQIFESPNLSLDDRQIEDPNTRTAISEFLKQYQKCVTDILFLTEQVKQLCAGIRKLQERSSKVIKLERDNFCIKIVLVVTIVLSCAAFLMSFMR